MARLSVGRQGCPEQSPITHDLLTWKWARDCYCTYVYYYFGSAKAGSEVLCILLERNRGVVGDGRAPIANGKNGGRHT